MGGKKDTGLDNILEQLIKPNVDEHVGLRAALPAVLAETKWQRRQFHEAYYANYQAPNVEARKRIGTEVRPAWNAPNLIKMVYQDV